MTYRLLDRFRSIFEGVVYKHRNSHHGDRLCRELFEDLYEYDPVARFREHCNASRRGISLSNVTEGRKSRRGDGSFGSFVPNEKVVTEEGFHVLRGILASKLIGIEVKILHKSMRKQINDRIQGLVQHAETMARTRDSRSKTEAIAIAVIGVNHAKYTIGYEGERAYKTDGTSKFPHPCDEASEIINKIAREIRPSYDETVVLNYSATNERPFEFSWIDEKETSRQYGAVIVRIAEEYARRFD